MIQVHSKHALGESGDEFTSDHTDLIRDGSEIYQLFCKGSAKCSWSFKEGMCITASGNILASGNLCFRVFKLQLKVINKNVCYLY